MLYRIASRLVVASAVLASGVEGTAAVLSFDTPGAFQAALTPGSTVVTETYESSPADLLLSSGALLNGLTYSFPTGVDGRVDDGNYNARGNRSLAAARTGDSASYFFEGESITVAFSSPVRAFSLYFNADTHTNGSFVIQAAGGTATTNGQASDWDDNTLFFVGLVSDTPFTSATFGSAAGGPAFNVDDLSVATGVPEPSSILLATGGLMALICLRRR